MAELRTMRQALRPCRLLSPTLPPSKAVLPRCWHCSGIKEWEAAREALVDTPFASPIDRRLLQDLQGVFWAFVKKHYTVERRDLILVTASLLFSLIPLHDPPMRRLFYKMCKAVMAQVRKG
ncbi:hypothetical protein AAT19DRAFT_10979 [Rhodotorula toruloides]|uniref:Uncharacterized protein n=1 Tax=Rhodotorula toruloides TaxID=5286 RepID=A0A2S9ZYJ8_RHOTO|nr:hypothetical protein AAT19DRAFT_10979 [Rhodotorula toruloides]